MDQFIHYIQQSMGCNNSTVLPQQFIDIRNTISKIPPEKQTCSEKKIAKNFKNFGDFVSELKLLLKEQAFYDYLFRAEYFDEMLDFLSTTYVSHQQTVKIVSMVLEFMAFTKNYINGRQILKTSFKVQSLAADLSKRWTQIRTAVFMENQNALRLMNYLSRQEEQKKRWFPHSYLQLKFDLSEQEMFQVATATLQLCKQDKRAFFYFSNYLAKWCEREYQNVKAVTVIQGKLLQALSQISTHYPPPQALNAEQSIFEHHHSYRNNSIENAAFQLDLGMFKSSQRVKALQQFIIDNAKASIKVLNEFTQFCELLCHKNGCSNYRSSVRVQSRSQKEQILKIKECCLNYEHPKQQQMGQIERKTEELTLVSILDNEYEFHRREVDDFCQKEAGVLKFKIFDMVRGECMFNDVTKLNECCDELLKQMTKKGYKLVELSNHLRGGKDVPHIALSMLIGKTICSLRLIFQYNLAQSYFHHFLDLIRQKRHLSVLTNLHILNQQITSNLLLVVNEIIDMNKSSKIQYYQRSSFSQVKPLFQQLVKTLPFNLDLSKKAAASLDFNLVLDEIEQYKLIVQQFVNDQIKIDRTDKIRRIAQYLFYEKQLDLSEALFSLYEKEIEENHAYLMDKIKHRSKEFIKSEVQLVEAYADSLHYLAQIYKEKGHYFKAIEYYQKYLPLNNLAHQKKTYRINVLKKIAELHKLEKDYDQAVKIYQQCMQLQGKEEFSVVQILQETAVAYRKQGKQEQALRCQSEALHIVEKILGKDCLEYSYCLKHIGEIYKQRNDYSESLDRLLKSSQIYKKNKSKYAFEYTQLLREIGLLYQKQGKINQALASFRQSLDITSKVAGNHLEQMRKLQMKIGCICLQLSANEEAIKKFKHCLQLCKVVHGSQSLQFASIMSHLGLVYQRLGDQTQGINCFSKCCKIRKDKLGQKSIQYIRTIINMGLLFDQAGKTQSALQKYQQSLRLLKESNQQEQRDEAILLNNIGLIQHDCGQYERALQTFADALRIQEKISGKESRQYANTLSNIGLVKDDMCKYSQALEQYKQCLMIYEKLNSKNEIAATYHNIATTLFHLSDQEQSLKYYQKCLQLQQSCKGSQCKEYSMCLHCIGIVKLELNHLQQAQRLFQQSKNIYKKLACSNSIDYAQIILSLGRLYLRRRQFLEAMVHFEEASSIIEANHQKNPIFTIQLLLNKGIACFSLKKYDQSVQFFRQGQVLCQKNNLKYRQYAEIKYYLGLIQMEREKYIYAQKYFLQAMNLQQKFHDKKWKLAAIKLAACSLINDNQENYKVYVSYLQEEDVRAKHEHHHKIKKDNKK